MSNPVFMTVVFEGKRDDVVSLYRKMKRLQERTKPLVKNGFYYPTRWLGNLVSRLNSDWHDVFCAGTWDCLSLDGNHMSFSTETAWHPPFALLKRIQNRYPSLDFYFEAEGDDWDWYLTNDADGRYFSSRYIVDCEPDIEYFDTINEACTYLSNSTGVPIINTWEALCEAAEKWNNKHPFAYWPINVKEIKVVGNDELWD